MSAAAPDDVAAPPPRFVAAGNYRARILDWLPVAVMAIVLLVACAKIAVAVATRPVSFDGAMNLEVARSLAEGSGYRRMYADHLGFSHAIQTRAPYILPAAAVFAAFGVGIWQAQLVNALYLVAFSLLVFALVRRVASWRWALAAVAVCLSIPGLEDNGLNGFGEVPALTWWLAALAVLYGAREAEPPDVRRYFIAGVLLGIAIVTKTVLLIGALAATLVLFAEVARRGRGVRAFVVLACALAAGMLLPVLLHEACRALAFGDVARWRAWLGDEWRMIHMQAGTRVGFPDNADVASKVHNHFGVLVGGLGTRHGIVAAWLLLPALLLVTTWQTWMRTRARSLIAMLAVFAAIYLVWWLAVTPTEKAWYRRIFNGALVWELMTVVLIATLWRHRARLSVLARAVFGVAAGLAIAIGVALAESSFAASGEDARSRLERELAAVNALPPDAKLYGIGWYSMPAIALYSGRRLDDLNDHPTIELEARSPVYLLLDSGARKVGIDAYWLDRYEHTEVAAVEDFSIVALHTDRRRDPFAGIAVEPARLRDYVDFHGPDYPYLFGFYGREGDGWRWARTDVEVLLKYGGERALKIDAFVPEPGAYHRHRNVAVTAWIGACKLDSATLSGRSEVRFDLKGCAPPVGSSARVRLLSDDVVDAIDDRQLALIVNGVGFVDGAAAGTDATP